MINKDKNNNKKTENNPVENIAGIIGAILLNSIIENEIDPSITSPDTCEKPKTKTFDETVDLKFGQIVKDTVTGFKGQIIALAQYATGCNQVLVQPKIDHEQKWVDGKWFDIERIQFVEDGKPIPTSHTGGARHADAPPTH